MATCKHAWGDDGLCTACGLDGLQPEAEADVIRTMTETDRDHEERRQGECAQDRIDAERALAQERQEHIDREEEPAPFSGVTALQAAIGACPRGWDHV